MSGGRHPSQGYGLHQQQQQSQSSYGQPVGGSVPSSASSSASSSQGQQRKVITGRVTKLLDNFGFIDNEVFFQLSVVRGGVKVKEGDSVYVDCSYSEHLPFKWNALWVQVLDPNSPLPLNVASNGSSSSSVPTTSTPSSVTSTFYGTGVTGGMKSTDPRLNDPRTASGRSNVPGSQQQSSHPLSNPAKHLDVVAGGFASRKPAFLSESNPNALPLGSDINGAGGGPRVNPFQSTNVLTQGQPQTFAGNSGTGNEITYTSTPGSAFVQPFVDATALLQQPAALGSSRVNPMSGLTVAGVMSGFAPQQQGLGATVAPNASSMSAAGSSRGSRWDSRGDESGRDRRGDGRRSKSRERNDRSDERRRGRERSPRNKNHRDNYPGRVPVGGGPGKDQFGRDLPGADDEACVSKNRDRSERNDSRPERETVRDRSDRREDTRDRHGYHRNTESPTGSTVGSVISSRYDSYQLGKCVNIPKYPVLTKEVSTAQVKTRYGNDIHVPSDFEVLLVNENFRLDINSIPKPIKFKFEELTKRTSRDRRNRDGHPDREPEKDKTDGTDKAVDAKDKKEQKENKSQEVSNDDVVDEYKAEDNTGDTDEAQVQDVKLGDPKTEETMETVVTSGDTEDKKPESSQPKSEEPSSQEESLQKKRKHEVRYAAKVILLSLPEMNEIYEKVFGYDFERSSYGFSTERSYPLTKLISFVTLKNLTEGGYSLLGGKFSAEKDGFIDDKKPNLIKTATRCVREQTGIDLSNCCKWISLGTFVYNRSSCLEESFYEYSTVFLPDIWSLLGKTEIKVEKQEEAKDDKQEPEQGLETDQQKPEENVAEETLDVEVTPTVDASSLEPASQEQTADPTVNTESSELLSRIHDFKVTELKTELDKRSVKYGRTAKKAELVNLLKEALESEQQAVAEGNPVTDVSSSEVIKMEEEEVVSASGTKRKVEETEEIEEQVTKKTAVETALTEELVAKAKISGTTIEVTTDASLSCLSLYQGLNHHKNDHFELSLSAEVLKESLIKHFGHFILSCLCQESNSKIIKNDSRGSESNSRRGSKPPTLVQLVFSFFDDRHLGYIRSEEGNQLISSCGFNLTKKIWTNITGGVDRIFYRNLETPSVFINKSQGPDHPLAQDSVSEQKESKGVSSSSVFFRNGIMYDVANLVDQSEEYSRAQLTIKDLKNIIAEKTNSLTDYESRQKKMSSAIEKQNEEICSMKREKDSLSRKNEELKKIIESTLESLNRGMKLMTKTSSTKEEENKK